MTKVRNLSRWLLWLIPLFSMLLVINAKVYLLVFVLFGGYLFISGRKLTEVVSLTLLLSIPFERVIRSWLFTVVPPGETIWLPGYEYYFGISVKLFLATALVILFLIRRTKDGHGPPQPKFVWLLLGFWILASISSVFAPRIDLAVTGLTRLWLALWLFFVGRQHIRVIKDDLIFYRYLVSVLVFLGAVGSLQFVFHHPLGIDMEDISSLYPTGFVTSDGEALYRVSGLVGHPTYFASFLSLLIPVAIGGVMKNLFHKKPLYDFDVLIPSIGILLGLIALVGTLSRSAWISLPLSIVLIAMNLKEVIKPAQREIVKKIASFIGLCAVITSLTLGPIILLRTESLRDVLTVGNGAGRLELIKHGLTMIWGHPFLGAGINHFTGEMMDQGVQTEFRGFIYPVHNTFLLIFSEMGIPAGIFFVGFIISLLLGVWKKHRNNWLTYGMLVGASTFLINAQFHALFNQDPTLDLFMVMLGYISVRL